MPALDVPLLETLEALLAPNDSGAGGHRQTALLTWHNPSESAVQRYPVTIGVPFPKGTLRRPEQFELVDQNGKTVFLQTTPLAHWGDGSIRWMLVDAVAGEIPPGTSHWTLGVIPGPRPSQRSASATAPRGPLALQLNEHQIQILVHGDNPAAHSHVLTLEFALTTRRGGRVLPRIEQRQWESTGPVRSTLALSGQFPGTRGLQFHARISLFTGCPSARVEMRLHNPRRARHRGGLWDLGDDGSILFRDFSIELYPSKPEALSAPGNATKHIVSWISDASDCWHSATDSFVEIHQETSGGPEWNSPNHVDRHGRVPLRFPGFRVRTANGERAGLRASPIVSLEDSSSGSNVTVAIPHFWQQFPKSLAADHHGIHAGLFPEIPGELHELQGGEQKTHTLWVSFEDHPAAIAWVHAPVHASLAPDWYVAAESPPYVAVRDRQRDERLINFLRGALAGDNYIVMRRDRSDEYGWRNFGDIPADHEQEFYPGAEPVVSHYNNQFDLIFGGILQHAATSDPGWTELFAPLARHVIDIDIYHTDRDRAAYNGGLFWHTDHYRTAATSTHRAYSKYNQQPGRPYGGGPGNEHNYSSGLLHYYFLTGNPDARAAVLSLADWVIAMDDGAQSIFGILDDGPTGLATATADADYHGPGRGAGNSLNTLTDAWTLTREVRYRDAAEAIIRRVVHPQDSIDSLDLLNAELRWSYTVFLVALSKWLDAKAEAGELDAMYAYGQHSLLHYARWMEQHERPYFDHRERLEFITATWPAQELRKANVLRLAARHAADPERTRFLHRGDALAERAWNDLEQFDNRFVARCLSLLMTEGAREAWLRTAPRSAFRMAAPTSWPERETFVPQKIRVKNSLRTPVPALRAALRLMNPIHWPGLLQLLRKHL